MPKTKVMDVSVVPAPAAAFTCNGTPIGQVATFIYLGLHVHEPGPIEHLVKPIKSKAGGSWAADQQRHSLLQYGRAIDLHLLLLHAVLVPVMQ